MALINGILQLMIGLLGLASVAVHADTTLAQWRIKADAVRILAENDTKRAYAEAMHLQAELPADAGAADQARLLNLLARIEIYLAQTEQASRHIRQAMALAKQYNDPVGQVEADLNTALNAINEAKVDEAIAAAIHSVSLLDGVDRPDLLGEALLRTAMMYRRTNQFEESVTMSMQALDIAEQSKNPLALIYAYQGLAIAYEQSGHLLEAGDYYRKMLEQAKRAGYKLMEGYAHQGLGYISSGLGDYKNAEERIRESIAVYRSVGAPFSLNFGQFALAAIFHNQQRDAESLRVFDEIIERYRRYPNKIGLWWTLNARSGSYMVLGNINAAERDAEQAYTLAREIAFPLYLKDSAKLLAGITAAKGDYPRAYRLMRESAEMAVKTAKDNAASQMLQLTQRYRIESKQREIDELSHRNLLQAAELEHHGLEQRWLWTVLSGSIVMLAGTGFFLVRLKHSHLKLKALNTRALQAKNKLQATLDAIPDPLFEMGLDGCYFDYHSPRAEQFQMPFDDWQGKSLADVMSSDAKKIVLSALQEAHENGRSTGKQFKLPLNQHDYWFELSIAAKQFVPGEAPRFIVLSRDISERKCMEAQALQREQEFRVLVENSPDLIFRYDKQCRRIYVNPAVTRFVGKPLNSLLNKSPSEARILSADEAAKLMRKIRQVLSTGRPALSEVACKGADGKLYYFHNRYSPEFDAHGNVVSVISIARDITERKVYEDALRQSEEKYRTLIQKIQAAVVVHGADTRILTSNAVAQEILGLSENQLHGKTAMDPAWHFRHEDGSLVAQEDYPVMKVIASGTALKNYVLGIPRSGGRCDAWVLVNADPVFGEHGEMVQIIVTFIDITQRKQAEQRLWLMDFALNQVREAVYVIDLQDLHFLNVNAEACRALGYCREELLKLTVYDIDPDAESEAMAKLQIEIDSTPDATIFERRHKTKAGHIFPVEINAKVFEYNGRPTSIAFARDITERKRAQHDIALMSQALNKVHEAAYMMDDEAGFLYVNEAASRALGYSREELLTMSVMDIGPGWTLEMVGEVWQRQREMGNVQFFEAFHRRKDGSVFPVEINANQFEYDGKTYGLALVRDITERKLAENEIRALNADLEQRVQERTQELRLQTRYLRTLIDTLPMMAWLTDREQRFLVVNQATASACAHDMEDLIGKTGFDFWPPEYAETFQADDEDALATRKLETIEELFYDARVGNIWVETFKAPVLDEDGGVLGVVGIARDISDRKALEHAREEALAEAERLAELRSEFMARMSHELRTPLNGILGYAQILLKDDKGNERESAMVRIIQNSGEYLLNMINDILDFAKIEAGKQELMPSDIRLSSFFRNIAGIIGIKAEQKGLEFVCDIADELPAGIRGDEMRLRQVLLNLLSNAVKYSEKGRIIFKVAMLDTERLRFEVRDSGIGIDTGQMETIFHAFEQAGDWRHRSGGTGLGLPISRELVRMMGSDIFVDSRVNEGSTFWFDLAVQEVEVCEDISNDDRIIVGYRGKRRHVMVVDDVKENRTLLIDMLQRLGFVTSEADNGTSCLTQMSTQLPDLILLDMVMPEMSGPETVRRLRLEPNCVETPIIAISASASADDVSEAMRAGVNVFLFKPIDIDKLTAQLADLLKLDWVYASSETAALPMFNESLMVPPLEEMKVLLRLAQEGGMRDIIKQADYIDELDRRFRPFTAQLRTLAQAYQSKAILELMERHINQIVTERP